MRTENYSPLNKIKSILVGSAGAEAVFGLMMPPHISLFEDDAHASASVSLAQQDHQHMVQEFEGHGITVFNMRRIIGEQIAIRNQSKFETPEQLLTELKSRAVLLHKHYGLGSLDQAYTELRELLTLDIKRYKRYGK